MATKKNAAKKAEDKKAKKGKKELTPEQIAKRNARKEALKNRPAGQRPNSKQVDIIDFGDKGKVENWAAPLRKKGCLVTSIAFDGQGNVVGTAVCEVLDLRIKTKKGHGYFQPGAPGVGKDSDEEDEATESKAESAEEEDDED